MKNTFTKMTLLLGTLVVSGVAMQAETLSVQIPFAFTAGGKTLPAGSYTMSSLVDRVLMIQGNSPDASVTVMIAAGEAAGKTGAVFSQASGKSVLSKVEFMNGSVELMSPEHHTASVPQPAAASALTSRR